MNLEKIDLKISGFFTVILVFIFEYFWHILRSIRIGLDGALIFVMSIIYAFIPIGFLNPKNWEFKHWARRMF